MNIVSTIRRMLRGEVSAGLATLEGIRRMNAGLERRRERANLDRTRLLIPASEGNGSNFATQAQLENRFSSRDYGQKDPSVSVCWTRRVATPFAAQFSLIPLRADETEPGDLRTFED